MENRKRLSAMAHQYPHVGAFYEEDGSCSFTVWSPFHRIDLVLEGKPLPMIQDDRGYWTTRLPRIAPGTPYRFRIDEDKTLPDPASRSQREGVHGPSFVAARDFPWTDNAWKGIALQDMIQYELHVGTFTPPGDFAGVISRLDYLADLGVNTIELMPVAQFPGTRNWGYDGVFPFAVQESYGGINGLKMLVNEAHRRGIAVILDVVYNHLGPEGNYLPAYGPYFTEKYKSFWGQALNFDDAWCDGVRHFFIQNALMWLEEFHIDGLRLDAVHAIWDCSANHFIQELVESVWELERRTGRMRILLAEFDLNNPRYINPVDGGGYGLDGQWADEFHHALHALITGEKSGYYEDFGRDTDLAKALRDSYVYTGQYSVHRKRNYGVSPSENPYSQFVVFSQNHDQVGNRMLGDRLTGTLSFEALKLAAATVLLSPHIPMLFMGEEYGEKNPFQYFVSHTDEKLVEAVREGRKKEFAHFQWKGEVPDPQAEETFRTCVLSWNYDRDERAALLLNFYKHLIRFRKERKAMKGMERDEVTVLGQTVENVIAFGRSYLDDRVLVVLNFNATPVSYSLAPGEHAILFDSAAKQWGGAEPCVIQSGILHLSAWSAVILEY